jgi:hypothetical protein
LEIENRRAAQEESKLKQERIKARTNEVQNAQQIATEDLKLKQEQERTKARLKEAELEILKETNRGKEIDLERYREENRREATTFEVERARNDQIETLAGYNIQKLELIKQILQLQLESGSTDGSQQDTISRNRLMALQSY